MRPGYTNFAIPRLQLWHQKLFGEHFLCRFSQFLQMNTWFVKVIQKRIYYCRFSVNQYVGPLPFGSSRLSGQLIVNFSLEEIAFMMSLTQSA